MTDLDIGMNRGCAARSKWDDTRRYDRGKVMTADELEAGRDFGRYLDVDGDGIPFRTYPGHAPDARRVFHPRHDQGRVRALLRGRPRLHVQHGAAAAEVRHRQGAGAAAGACAAPTRRAQLRRDLLRLDQPGDGRGARRAGRARRVTSTRCACARSRSRTPCASSSPRTTRCSSSSRTATRRSSTMLVNELQVDPQRLVPVLHYDGTPITARFIIRAHHRSASRAPGRGDRRSAPRQRWRRVT